MEQKIVTTSSFDSQEFLGKIKSYLYLAATKTVVLSPGFFREYTCEINCGACCHKIVLEYLEDSQRWIDLKEQFPEKALKFTLIDDDGAKVWRYDQKDNSTKFCSFLDSSGRCTNHLVAPFPCKFALSKFLDKTRSSEKSFLTTSAYGRGHSFLRIDLQSRGAMCKVITFSYEKLLRDIGYLKELREYGKKLQIPTKLKYIIDTLEDNLDFYKSLEGQSVNPYDLIQPLSFTQENIF